MKVMQVLPADCVGCGQCATVCDYGALKVSYEGYYNLVLDWIKENCVYCFECVSICPGNAIRFIGNGKEEKE